MAASRPYRPASVLALCAIGAACVASHTTTRVRSEISIVLRDGSRPDGCDVGDPRLVRAMSETAAIVGRPVELQIVFDRLPRPIAPFCDALFEHHIGTLPRDLTDLREHDPDRFAFAQPRLTRVVLDYDGTRDGSEASFVDGTLAFVMGSAAGIPRGGVDWAVREAFRAHLVATFRGRRPAEVAAADYPLYFYYLGHVIEEGEPSGDRNDRINGPRAEAIVRAVELEELLGPGRSPLRDEVGHWLVGRAPFFSGARFNERDQIERAAQNSSFRRAERAWSAWLQRELPRLAEEDLASLWRHLVIRREGDVELVADIDLIAFGLGVIDEWIAAGAPGPGDERLTPAAARVVCPCGRDEQGRLSCGGDEAELYRYVLADPARRTRFVEDVLGRDDPRLTLTVAAHFRDQGTAQGDLLELFTLAETHDASWRTIARYIAEELRHFVDDEGMRELRSTLVDAAARLWRSHPDRRPALLYLLALFDGMYGRYHGMVEWERFARTFGSRVGRDDFAAFLDFGPLAADAAWAVWPALSAGWSRTEVLMPRLATHHGIPGLRIDQSLWRVVHQMRPDEVSAVRAYLQQRVRDNPAEHGLWQAFTDAERRP
jgi:hypothetical protein